VHNENFANAMMKLFELDEKERKLLSRKVKKYANTEFGYQKTIDDWHKTMIETIENFKSRKNWQIEEI
jgi:hypothetical protein